MVGLSNNFSYAALQPHIALTCGIQPLKNHDGKTSLLLMLRAFLQQIEHCSRLRDPRRALQGKMDPSHPPAAQGAFPSPREAGRAAPRPRSPSGRSPPAGGRGRRGRRAAGRCGGSAGPAAPGRSAAASPREPWPTAARKGAGGGGGATGKRNQLRRPGKRRTVGKSPARRGRSSEGRVFCLPAPRFSRGVNGL